MIEDDLIRTEEIIEAYPWYSLARLDMYKKLREIGEEQAQSFLGRVAPYVPSRAILYKITHTNDHIFFGREENFEIEEFVKIEEIEEIEEIEKAGINIGKTEIKDVEIEQYVKEDKKRELVDEPIAEPVEEEPIDFEIDNEPLESTAVPKYIMVGGDYFSRKDFEDLKSDGTSPLDGFIMTKPQFAKVLAGQDDNLREVAVADDEEFEDTVFYTETLANIYKEQGFYKRAIDVYAKLILLYPEKSSYFASLVQELKKKNN